MANVRNSNSYYIDTTTALSVSNLVVTHVIVTATSANAVLLLRDETTADNKLDLRVVDAGTTEVFDFSDNPVVFPTGIKPQTVTNCVAICLIREGRS